MERIIYWGKKNWGKKKEVRVALNCRGTDNLSWVIQRSSLVSDAQQINERFKKYFYCRSICCLLVIQEVILKNWEVVVLLFRT